jgi:enterochelin esterase family protein
MKAFILLAALVGVVGLVFGVYFVVVQPDTDEDSNSPRLAKLAKQLIAGDAVGDREAVDRFWEELMGQGPLIEPVADDPHSSWITFLWRGDQQTRNVAVLGGPVSGEYGARLSRLANTSLWYRTDRIPNDARMVYRFLVDLPDNMPRDPAAEDKFFQEHPLRADPLNPREAPTHDGSIVELREAPTQPWLERLPGVRGRDIQEFKIHSEILEQDRTFAVYTPPGYDAKGEPYGLLVMFDGSACRQEDYSLPVCVILDNLITQKKIASLVTVFVYQTEERNNELACSEKFADFVAKELIPQVRRDFRVTVEPGQTVISGFSLGGLMSAFTAYRHPGVFGKVLSLSGAYHWCPGMFEGKLNVESEPGWLTRQLVASERLPLNFYLAAGRFENTYPFSLLGENRRLRDVLLAKGYAVQYSEFSGGHDALCWRGPFVEGLIGLSGTGRQKE